MSGFRNIFLLFFISVISGASAEIVWIEKDYDFGLMKEEAGPQTGKARFINKGPLEICVTGVRTSCGCTSAIYPQEPVSPGDTATITFTYDPKGRPGRFQKSVRVYVGDSDTYLVRIKGNVLGTPRSLSKLYPIENGALRLSEALVAAGDVTYGTTRHFFVNGYNQSGDSITPVILCTDPALSVSASQEKLGPGDIVTYGLYFNSRNVSEIGHVDIPLKITADKGNPNNEVTISLTANVIPDLSKLTKEDVDHGPRCYLLPERIDMGILKSGSKNPHFKFAIRNEGEKEMRIMRVYSPSGKVKISRFPTKLNVDKAGEAEGTLLLDKVSSSPFNIKIEVITDDPLHPVRILHLVGQIE